jgi:hypothetical protein
MRWPWDRGDQAEKERRAERALKETQERVKETRQRDARGRRLAETIREMRRRNHLAEAVERALRGGA